MSDVYDLGLIIKELRQNAGMSQKELGMKINRDKGISSRYECNLQTPSFEIMRDFSRIFNVSMDYLAGFKQPNSINTVGLSEEQTQLVRDLVELLQSGNSRGKFTAVQFELLSRIADTFSKQ